MCDHAPSTTPDHSVELARREIRDRYVVGILIAVGAILALVGYVILRPGQALTALLVASGIAGVGLIVWVQRSGEGHEHQRHTDRVSELEARAREVLVAVDASRIEHRRELEQHRQAFEQHLSDIAAALTELAQRIDDQERDRDISLAEASAADTLTRLAAEVGRGRGGGGYAPVADRATPPGGITMLHGWQRRSRRTAAEPTEGE